jgi:hypothetical protein
MGFRRFTDREKRVWEIRPVGRSEWEFSPSGENREKPRTVASPGYEKDPFELSQEELQQLLDGASSAPVRKVKNPFGD